MATRFNYRLSCFMGAVFLFASIAVGSDSTTVYKPLKIQQPPRIDGKLDEPCWDQATKVTRFFKVGDEKPPVAAQAKSTVSLCYDAENIYVGMVCFEPAMKDIEKDFSERDDPIYRDDCVEIFISPDYTDLSSYYHFLVNPAGTQTDRERNNLRGSNWGWNGKWIASVRLLKDRWVVELRIPFLDLGIEDSASVNLLGVSVCRARQPDEAENTAWQIGGSFLRPQGQVVLTSVDQFVEKDLLPLWQREKASILERLKNDDGMSRGRREELEAVVKHVDREIALGQKRPTGQAIRTMANSIKKAQNTGLPMRPEPWLAGVTANSVYVCLEASDTSAATVEFGLTREYGRTATTERTQTTDFEGVNNGRSVHNIKLTGLQANTQYHYRARHASDVSEDYSFWTAPLPGTYARWGFASDMKFPPHGLPVHNDNAALLAAKKPRMMVYGGDLANPGVHNWNLAWFVPNQNALNATAPFVDATGNHEDWNSLTKAYTESPDGTDGAGNGYYSFDYGDAHILILNNELSCAEGSPQWNFALADLAATKQKWKIVVHHQSAYVRYVPGSYMYNYDGTGKNAEMEHMSEQVFAPAGVDLVLGGHMHTYQHSYINGVHHVVSAPYGMGPRTGNYNDWTVYAQDTNGYIIIETTSQTLTVTTYQGVWGPHGTMGLDGNWKTMDIHGELKKRDYVCPDAGRVVETFTLGELPGDVNGDIRVDSVDATTILGNLGMKDPKRNDGDLNADGVVDKDDLQEVRDNWGAGFAPVSAQPTAISDSVLAELEELRTTAEKQVEQIQQLHKKLAK